MLHFDFFNFVGTVFLDYLPFNRFLKTEEGTTAEELSSRKGDSDANFPNDFQKLENFFDIFTGIQVEER